MICNTMDTTGHDKTGDRTRHDMEYGRMGDKKGDRTGQHRTGDRTWHMGQGTRQRTENRGKGKGQDKMLYYTMQII